MHVPGLRRYATALLGDYIEAEDLVQECFVRALSHEHVWERVHNRRAYLFTILHNIYVDYRAKRRRYERNIPLDDASVSAELNIAPDQHERLEIRDFEQALRELPDNYKAVTLLVGLEGMSYQQAAHHLGVPIGTVMSRLSRGRKILRRRMDGEDIGDSSDN
jgi:RNA polymerase sigma-70 factor (ECF subfamily)